MTSYRIIASDMTRSLSRISQQPMVQRETEYYLENIGNVKSVDDFMNDDRLYRYAMKAFGLDDMSYAKAFVRKVLTEGVIDPDSFANRLSDTRYKELATAFNFSAYGDKATTYESAKQGTVDKYMRQTLEENAGQQNEGVRLALYFTRKASSIKSAYNILGDKALLTVFQTAFNIPAATGNMNIDKQAKMIEDLIDIDSFQDPEVLNKFLTRFTAMYEMNNMTAASASPAVMLLGGSASIGISDNILTTLQSFKLGGR
ncbi:MAG: DUF1217 domain-containing protein [Phyllobacterium sp.]